MTPRQRKSIILSIICASLALAAAPAGFAAVHHDLSIHLDLHQRLLSGIDRLRLTSSEAAEPLILNLAPRAQIQTVQLDGRPVPYHFEGGQLRIETAADWRDHRMEIRYSCRFDDPLPATTLNTDNPGYGVSGTISPEGVFILAGAHWYPQSSRDRSIRLAVEAPRGFVAVTSGDLIEHRDLPEQTISRWHCDPVVEALSLVAGPYLHRVHALNGIGAATYFTAALDHLAPTYLTATGEYLALYEELFGPYAFRHFAVVENFFPTGYGFPGFTLIGGRVLMLPFIPHTSLGHEIAHCWWGNGVLVDNRQGNWAEGLTTYVAEHLYKERASAEHAYELRREWLRNYASLIPIDRDRPLADFIGRADPVTKTVGYDKAAMLFHMLRRIVGDAIFWRTLREVYAERRFRHTSWSDLASAFETHSGKSLGPFFAQWIGRAGAPQLVLEQVETLKMPSGWSVRGRVRQTEPTYILAVPLQLTLRGGTLSQVLHLDGRWADFAFESPTRPLRLTVDPQADLFRRLTPAELPATVNFLRGAPEVTITVAPQTGASGTEAALVLKAALGADTVHIAAAPLDPWSTQGALILIGPPADLERWNAEFPALTLATDHFTFEGQSYPRKHFSFFGVFRIHHHPVALYLPAGEHATTQSVAAKISHYGTSSYLIFDGTQNARKGVWPAADSPLQITWPQNRGGEE